MTTYATTPQSFFSLLGECIANYSKVFKPVWRWVLLAVALSLIGSFLIKFNPYVGWAVYVLVLLANLFIFGVMLHLSHTALLGNVPNTQESLTVAKKRYLSLLGVYLIFVLVSVLLGFVDYAIFSLGNLVNLKIVFTILGIVAGLITLLVIFLLFFAFPIVILEKLGVFKSYEKSIKLVWGNWWRIFGIILIVYIILVAVLFVLFIVPIIGFVMLSSAKAFPPFGTLIFYITLYAIAQILAIPLYLSTILTVLNDLKLRKPELDLSVAKKSV